ncbi:MAG: GH116 family glycosyl-hydrolase [Candidatus Zipacnadales bacterium]
MTSPRVYTGEHLAAVAMPIGGIGTGTIWLDGQGRLSVWQIFNNYTEVRIPDSFFAVRAQADGEEAVVRVLQISGESGFEPVSALTYEAGYPIAHLTFQDDALPVTVQMEAFNPFIPTDAPNSALPCAIFRLSAQNTSAVPITVSLLGTLQNAVGSQGRPGVDGVYSANYGGNENTLLREKYMTAAHLTRRLDPPLTGIFRLRRNGLKVEEAPPLLWIDELSGLTETTDAELSATQAVLQMADMATKGGVIVAGNVQPEFFHALRAVRQQTEGWDQLVVFEDWEDGTYEGWLKSGQAFADAPHTGTSPGQQLVSGFMGSRLVNTFVPNDQPQGELISKPFRVEHRYIGFLIGGGNHPGQTCVNLRVGEAIVRSATGKNVERLEPVSWDVSEFIGQEAQLEIIDHHSGGWGHINVDHIVFADAPPEGLLQLRGPLQLLAQELDLTFIRAVRVTPLQSLKAIPQVSQPHRFGDGKEWWVREFTRVEGLDTPSPPSTTVATEQGDQLVIASSLGKATIFLVLAPEIPFSWVEELYFSVLGREREEGERLVTDNPGYGSMALATPNSHATVNLGWTDAAALVADFAEDGQLSGPQRAGPTPQGQTVNCGLCVRFQLQPLQVRTACFIITWHFPNVQRFGHSGNQYARRFGDAASVARYICRNLDTLWGHTELYHQTVYESNIPEEFIDAMTSQSVIFRGPTVWWDEEDYFAGFEGAYECCPLNCTHVWNYAQTHARLFPEIDRNMRRSDLLTFLHPNGETSHRQHALHGAFIDGQCATIEAALRAHQMSTDKAFLEQVWPNLVKATNWLIDRLDPARNGVPQGSQPNTYDCEIGGANTFIGSQYLAALAAAEQLAEVMGETGLRDRWHKIRQAGMVNQNAQLWNGEYYYQIPEATPHHDYNTGCHSDQLLGQWWAHMLNLGYLYPPERIRTALASIMRYNYRDNFVGFQQRPRRYVLDHEPGLVMCTWPKGGRPEPFIIYADEVWTGIEYSTAGLMIFEGMIEEARQIVRAARSRYDGRLREGLNSGPGGNPFNELECGKFYARAMSSWGLLIACQGFIIDGPAGVIGFKPRWQPEDHRSFFTAPESWGLFVQTRSLTTQVEEIQVRHGRLSVRELVFEVAQNLAEPKAIVRFRARRIPAKLTKAGTEVRLRLPDKVTVAEGESISVVFSW